MTKVPEQAQLRQQLPLGEAEGANVHKKNNSVAD